MVLQGVSGVQCYLKDIVVFGDSVASHNAHLQRVLHKRQEADLRLNDNKCTFYQEKLTYYF